MTGIINKIKKLNTIVKQLTLLLKSFKSLIDILVYIFLAFYIGYDKISNTFTIQKTKQIELDYGLTTDAVKNIKTVDYNTFYIDPFALIIILTLIVLIGIKINNLINKDKK